MTVPTGTTVLPGIEIAMIKTYTPREAILHSASLLKTEISVEGEVAILDRELRRLDLTSGGGKLIVRLRDASAMDPSTLELEKNIQAILSRESTTRTTSGDQYDSRARVLVRVTGVLRKEQRRTFLAATKLESIQSEE